MGDVVIYNDRVKQLTLEIKEIQDNVCQGLIEIGKRLIDIKEELSHGSWLPYLKDELGYSQVTATRLMRVAREFSGIDSTRVSSLNSSKIFELLSLHKDDRDTFLSEHNANISDMTVKELRGKIKEVRYGEDHAGICSQNGNTLHKPKQRKPIPVSTKKQLAVRSGGKCEVCGKGNEYLVSWLIEHHIVEHCKTQDDSMDNLLMVCPNCHNFIHSLKNTTDTTVKENLSKGIIEMVGIDTYNEIVKYVN